MLLKIWLHLAISYSGIGFVVALDVFRLCALFNIIPHLTIKNGEIFNIIPHLILLLLTNHQK